MNITDKVFLWLSISDIDLSTLYEFMSLFDSIDDIWNLDKYQGKIMNNAPFKAQKPAIFMFI